MKKYTVSVSYTGEKPIDQEQLAKLVIESLLSIQENIAPSAPQKQEKGDNI